MCPTLKQDLIHSFKNIYLHANSYERRLMIDELFAESSPSDLWYIHHKLEKKHSYYFDILSHLPCELLQIILKYLNLEDILVFPMVCKRWKALFTNSDITKMLISDHFGRKNIKNTSNNDWYLLFQNYSKKYIRFQQAKPKSFYTLYFYNKGATCYLHSCLRDNYLILYTHSTTESSSKGITLYRLKSGISQEDAIYISTKNNEAILCASLDSNILVCANYFGVFYIWSLENLKLIQLFKLENSDIASIACHNDNICIYTFSHILSMWNLKLKKIMFRLTLKQINPNVSNKHKIIIMEFSKKSNELILCIENTTTNNRMFYYEYNVYVLSSDGHFLRHKNLINKHRPFNVNIINESELITFYEFNSDHYWEMNLETMELISCLSYKNIAQEFECLIYPQNSIMVKYIRSTDDFLNDGLYVEKIDQTNGVLMSKNKILHSENIIYDEFHYIKNKHLLQGNDNWIVYNQRNKIFLWEF